MVRDIIQMQEKLGIAKQSLSIPDGDVPDILWHYTSRDGLWGILTSKEFRATHSSFLNDTSEVAKVYKKLYGKFDAKRIKGRPKELQLSRFLSNLENRIPENGSECKSVYVISMTDVGDSLPHWTGYTKQQTGDVAIGIKINKSLLKEPTARKRSDSKLSLFLQQCLYYSDIDDILDGLVGKLKEFFVDDPTILDDKTLLKLIDLGGTLAHAQYLLPCLKSKCFEYEREWRVYACLENKKSKEKKVSFANGRPYLPVPLSDIGSITKIIVSPYGNREDGLLYCKMLQQLGPLDANIGILSSAATIR